MITILPIDDEERAQYQRFYKEHTPVGWMEEESITPSGCARDCGDHYIVAHYGSYTRVDKRTLTVTKDVEDK